jgi:hypothetical protein
VCCCPLHPRVAKPAAHQPPHFANLSPLWPTNLVAFLRTSLARTSLLTPPDPSPHLATGLITSDDFQAGVRHPKRARCLPSLRGLDATVAAHLTQPLTRCLPSVRSLNAKVTELTKELETTNSKLEAAHTKLREIAKKGKQDAAARAALGELPPNSPKKGQAAASQRGHGAQFAPLSLADKHRLRRAKPATVSQVMAALLREHHTRVLDLFRVLDTNRDGVVSKAELRKALHTLGVSAPSTEVEDLFRKLDPECLTGRPNSEATHVLWRLCSRPVFAPPLEQPLGRHRLPRAPTRPLRSCARARRRRRRR